MPCGTNHHGFLARTNSPFRSWIVKWFQLLDALWYDLHLDESSLACPDFFFAQLNPDGTLAGPLSYCQALKIFRYCIASVPDLNFSSEQIHAFTMHSCKATVLSWAAQLSMPAEDRASQGHHAFFDTRDDVFPSLQLQKQIKSSIFDGHWRPNTPLSTGSQPNLQEPHADLHLLDVLTEPNFAMFRWVSDHSFHPVDVCNASASLNHPVTESSDNKLDANTTLDQPVCHKLLEPQVPSTAAAAVSTSSRGIHFIVNKTIAHVAIRDQQAPKGWRSKCGALSTQDPVTELPPGARLCKRIACMSTFQHY